LRGLLTDGRDPSAQRRIMAEEQRVKLAEVKAATAQRKAEARRATLTLKDTSRSYARCTRKALSGILK